MIKLTENQREVLKHMGRGYKLLTTEGTAYKAFLKRGSDKINVHKSTALSLAEKKVIEPVHYSDSVFFEWKISKKANVLI